MSTPAQESEPYDHDLWEIFHNAYTKAVAIGHRRLAVAIAEEANTLGFHFDDTPTMFDNPKYAGATVPAVAR